MSVTITLPGDLEALLRRAASAQNRTTEAVALDILREALLEAEDNVPTIDDIVAFLRAAPPTSANFRPARGSLAAALAETKDAEFDRASWEAAWSQAEAEIAALSEDDEQTQGR
jgi:plasmid stability protein